MATLYREKNGTRKIQFRAPDRKRRSLRLGRMDERSAEDVKAHVEDITGGWERHAPPSPATANWVAGLLRDPSKHWLYDRMARVGLVTTRKEEKPKQKPNTQEKRLEGFLQAYFDRRTDVKPSSKTAWEYPRRDLIEHFGADKLIDKVTVGDANDFERFMKKKHKSLETVRRRLGMAKQFFGDAVDRELILRNPFAKLKTAGKGNRSRDFFVTREMAEKVIQACPDAEWRLIFALCRFGGLRCPSEVMALRLDDVDWDNEKILVRSPKTEHHEGKESRLIPLFPELRPYLEEVWHKAEPGTEFFVSRKRRHAKTNSDHLQNIIENAGLKPWPKLFQNLRATRETELAEDFPAHVVCAWIGNSEAIARKHYLQVTDDHFSAAVNTGKSGAKNVCSNGAKQGTIGGQRKSANRRNPKKQPVLGGFTNSADRPTMIMGRGERDAHPTEEGWPTR